MNWFAKFIRWLFGIKNNSKVLIHLYINKLDSNKISVDYEYSEVDIVTYNTGDILVVHDDNLNLVLKVDRTIYYYDMSSNSELIGIDMYTTEMQSSHEKMKK